MREARDKAWRELEAMRAAAGAELQQALRRAAEAEQQAGRQGGVEGGSQDAQTQTMPDTEVRPTVSVRCYRMCDPYGSCVCACS